MIRQLVNGLNIEVTSDFDLFSLSQSDREHLARLLDLVEAWKEPDEAAKVAGFCHRAEYLNAWKREHGELPVIPDE